MVTDDFEKLRATFLNAEERREMGWPLPEDVDPEEGEA